MSSAPLPRALGSFLAFLAFVIVNQTTDNSLGFLVNFNIMADEEPITDRVKTRTRPPSHP